jgi:hypothetical protein
MGTDTLLLDQQSWDLLLDANGNIAVASAPYALAQDAASAIKTFLGECYWDTTIGVPYLQQILGQRPPLALLKQQLIEAAESVLPADAAVSVFVTQLDGRVVAGQVQVTEPATGTTMAATFSVVLPQGTG